MLNCVQTFVHSLFNARDIKRKCLMWYIIALWHGALSSWKQPSENESYFFIYSLCGIGFARLSC